MCNMGKITRHYANQQAKLVFQYVAISNLRQNILAAVSRENTRSDHPPEWKKKDQRTTMIHQLAALNIIDFKILV
jgi:hypothetical protein